MAEYMDYGPGWNATGRALANLTEVMTAKQYAPYSSVGKVFQYPFTGKSGNDGWLDKAPEAR